MVKEKKKEPPGHCEACNKRLSRKSDVSRHGACRARKIQSGNNVERKVKLIYLKNNVTSYIQLKSLCGTSIKIEYYVLYSCKDFKKARFCI